MLIVALLMMVIGLALVGTGIHKIDNPGLTRGYLTPAPVDWDAVWAYIIIGSVLFLLPWVYGIWGAISVRRANPGMSFHQALAAQEQKNANAAVEQAGYVNVKQPEQHCTQCYTPTFTGQKAKIRVGIGSVWQCPRCHQRWVLIEHEHEVSINRTRHSRWRRASTGE